MAAGQEILAFCGKCKLDLMHNIIAHKEGNSGAVAKCQCRTCQAIHGYRAPKGSAGTVKARSAAAKRAPRQKVEQVPCNVEWKRQLEEKAGKPEVPYNIKANFVVGDILAHPKFGVGVVQTLKDSTKVEVLFQDDVKILVHNK